MTETTERTALAGAILKHWQENCRRMVRDLEQQNRLEQSVFKAQETAGDLLFEPVSVKKMDYPAAWELATREWALPQKGNQGEDLPPTLNPSAETSKSAKSRSATSHRMHPRRRRRTSR
jgi:hypothetical protein